MILKGKKINETSYNVQIRNFNYNWIGDRFFFLIFLMT